MIESRGILDMLKGFIYFEYAKDLMNQQTPFGNVQQTTENSKVRTLQTMMFARYNESITTYQNIRNFILLNSTLAIGQGHDSIDNAKRLRNINGCCDNGRKRFRMFG